MEDGLVSPVDEGTPQGGPLSPILSNLVLQSVTVDQRAEAIHHGMARLLRLLPDSASPHEPRKLSEPAPICSRKALC
jgi:hypothetical protein